MLRALNTPTPPLRLRPACRVASQCGGRPSTRRRGAGGGPRRAVPQPPVRRPSGDRACTPWRGGVGAAAPAPVIPVAAAGARDELEAFLEVVPARMRRGLARHPEVRELVEVVMDLGRRPLARFPSGDWVISEQAVTADDLHQAVSKVWRHQLIHKDFVNLEMGLSSTSLDQ